MEMQLRHYARDLVSVLSDLDQEKLAISCKMKSSDFTKIWKGEILEKDLNPEVIDKIMTMWKERLGDREELYLWSANDESDTVTKVVEMPKTYKGLPLEHARVEVFEDYGRVDK